jgi:Mg-chelatase subunit ChlD
MASEILFILDRSGSMASMRADAIGGFNSFLADQKKVKGKANLTLIQFDHEYEQQHASTPLKDVAPLTEATYVPRGSTALLDAMGRGISDLKARAKSKDKKIVCILTDGQENASREFNKDKIKKLTEECQKDGWSFVYLGANQDAMHEAQTTFGIDVKSPTNLVANYAASAVGMSTAYTTMSTGTRAFRSEAKP